MAIDILPGQIVGKTRDQAHADWLRSYTLRRPSDDTAPKTVPDAEAWIMADQLVVCYANAKAIGDNCVLKNKTGDALDTEGYYEGVTRPGAVGSHGYVKIGAAAGGTRIFAGDFLRDAITGQKFYCTQTARYLNNHPVPIAGTDVGPGTNLAAGTVLQWTAPRDGCATLATVVEQTDGSGLSGGRDKADDDEYRELIRLERANRARSGNDADIRRTVKDTPNLKVQEVFTIPATLGGGTTGVTFTMKPARLGGSRCPTEADLRLAYDYLRYKMPGDDAIFMMQIIGVDLNLQFQVTWASEAESWLDASPWPLYSATHYITVASSPAPTATTFRLQSASGVYTSTGIPVIGRRLAFWDEVSGRYIKKPIAGVTGTGPWDIVTSTDPPADTTFVPAPGARPMPWSDSLDPVAREIAKAFEKLGPGEQQSVFWDHGGRQRRYPLAPKAWPFEFNYRALAPLFSLPQVSNIVAPQDITTSPSVGTPGTCLYLLEMGEVAFYKK